MIIEQFYDKGLAHGSYALISEGQMVLIDPARDPQPYFDFAKQHKSKIVGVIETHPHVDFVSSHLDIHQKTGATIYASKLLGAEYSHQSFDDGDVGRPDLRENVGNISAQKEELAKAMYYSTRQKLMTLPEDILVYPAHGPYRSAAGSIIIAQAIKNVPVLDMSNHITLFSN